MTEPANRRPVYGRSNADGVRASRVVSVQNGLWQAQRRTSNPPSRERDPWESMGRPLPWAEACAAARVDP